VVISPSVNDESFDKEKSPFFDHVLGKNGEFSSINTSKEEGNDP